MKINKKTGAVAIETIGDALKIIKQIKSKMPEGLKETYLVIPSYGTNTEAIRSNPQQEQI